MKIQTIHRRLALLLCVCLLVGCIPVRAAELSFTDVQESDWFAEYAATLSEAGVIAGYPDGTFRPNQKTTAGEALRLILSAAGWEDQEKTDTHWASGYLSFALEQGFLSAGEITDLDAPIPRLLIAQVAARALGLSGSVADTPFLDIDDALVTALFEVGILSGSFLSNGARVFLPEDYLTRAEVSSIIYHIFLYQENMKQTEIEEETNGDEPLRGVDVSAHNGDIDWQAVAEDGYSFAMIRIGYRGYTEGNIRIDRKFYENIEGAQAAGLSVGVYFFSQATTVDEAIEEAEFALQTLEGYSIDYPVVFDWERISGSTARTDDVDTETLCACARAFCHTVEAAGYHSMIYFYPNLAEEFYDLSQLTEFDFWYANYKELDDIGYDVQMWQYTSAGTVSGMEGEVDLNCCFAKYGN